MRTMSPTRTTIAATSPAKGEQTSTTAFSASPSASRSPAWTRSPTATCSSSTRKESSLGALPRALTSYSGESGATLTGHTTRRPNRSATVVNTASRDGRIAR